MPSKWYNKEQAELHEVPILRSLQYIMWREKNMNAKDNEIKFLETLYSKFMNLSYDEKLSVDVRYKMMDKADMVRERIIELMQ